MWLQKDRYKTDSGAIMTIVSIDDGVLVCEDGMDKGDGFGHTFDMAGRTLCSACEHGHLKKRLTGTIQDAEGRGL